MSLVTLPGGEIRQELDDVVSVRLQMKEQSAFFEANTFRELHRDSDLFISRKIYSCHVLASLKTVPSSTEIFMAQVRIRSRKVLVTFPLLTEVRGITEKIVGSSTIKFESPLEIINGVPWYLELFFPFSGAVEELSGSIHLMGIKREPFK